MSSWKILTVQARSENNRRADAVTSAEATYAKDGKFAVHLLLQIFVVFSLLWPVAPVSAQGESPEELIETGDLLFSQNDFLGAERAYTDAIAADADYAPAYAHRCYLRVFQGRSEDALADCQKAVELDPDDSEGYVYLTRAYDWAGEYEKAVETGEHAIALAPDNGLAHSFLGEAYLDLERMEEGGREIHLAVQLAPGVAEVHRNLAYWYSLIEQPENQLKALQAALQLAPEFSDYLLEIGIVYESAEQYQEALDYYQRALAIQQQHRDRVGEVRTLNRLGASYLKLKQYTQAVGSFQQMLPIMQEMGDRAGEGAALMNMAAAQYRLGEYTQALERYQQCLVIWQEIGRRDRELSALQSIGAVHETLGHSKEALDYYQQALTLARELSDLEAEASLLNNIGAFYVQVIGRYDLALDYFLQELVVTDQLGDQGGQQLALENLGLVYFNLGKYQQALNYYQQALTMAEETKDRVSEYEILQKMAFVYMDLAQDDQALSYLQQSLDIRRKVGHQSAEAAILNSMAMLYLGQEQYQQALEAAQTALRLFEKAGSRLNLSAPLIHMGVAYDGLGQPELAVTYFERGLEIAREIDDPYQEAAGLSNLGQHYLKQKQYDLALDYFQQTLEIARRAGIRQIEAGMLIFIGEVYEAQQDTSQALAFYQQALDFLEAIRTDIRIDVFKTSFSTTYADVYERLILLLWGQGRTQEAFTYVERARARAFLDQLAEGSIDYRSGTNSALLEREQELKNEISALRSRLLELRSLPQEKWDGDAIAAAQTSLAASEAEYAQLLTQIKLQSPEAASLVSVDVAALSDVQALLDPETSLVEYFVTKDRTLVFLITHDNLEGFALEVSRSDLEETVTSFRDFASLNDPHPASLKQLYAWLVAPWKERIQTPALGIIPHSVLLYLPFAALTDGEKYLSDDYVLFTLPSASVLRFVQEKRKTGTSTILALGNPASALPDLKFAEQEAQSIAGLYGAQALVGKDATESAVRARASEAGILHIAAHGEYDPQNPLFSTIHLAGDAENDGRLEVHEVYSLDLATSTDLVVLSACQTDVGAVSAGDEVVGLNRAFLYAGTPTVIASLWNVDDAATTLLMEKFYSHLRAGASKAQALRQAQLDVRATYPHPYYWAAFVLTGDPGTGVEAQSPLPFSGSSRILWLAGFAGSLLCAFLAILVIYSAGKGIRNRRLRGRAVENDEKDPGTTDTSPGNDA